MTTRRFNAADVNTLHDEIRRINQTVSPWAIGLFDPFLSNSEYNPFAHANKVQQNYPPYNIKKKGDDYIVEIAVAGFSKEAITIEYKDRTLTVKGDNPPKDEDVEIVYNGLANRAFTRTFTLADTLIIEGATLDNGILTITCKQLIPEHLKPKTIEITSGVTTEEVSTSKPQLLCED